MKRWLAVLGVLLAGALLLPQHAWSQGAIVNNGLRVSDGNVEITNTDNTARQLQLYEPSTEGTNFTAFQAQAQANNIIYTLPPSLAAGPLVSGGRILQSDGNGNLSWLDPSALSAATAGWALTGNAITSAWNGTSGNFLGTTNAQPLVIATTFTATPQPIQFWTGNTERMRITATGEVVVRNQALTGATRVIIRAGANQGTVNLLEWQNKDEDLLGSIRPDGSVVLVYAPPTRLPFFAVANTLGVPLIGIGPNLSGDEWGVAVYEPNPPFGDLRAGMGKVASGEWRIGVGDLGLQSGVLLSWKTAGTANEPRIVVANGDLTDPVFLVDREGDVTVKGRTVALPNIPTAVATDDVLRIDPATGEVKKSTVAAVISAGIIKGSFPIAASGSTFTISVAPADIQPGAIVTVTLVGPTGGTIYPLMVTNVNAVAETITVESSATIPGGAGYAIHYIIINNL